MEFSNAWDRYMQDYEAAAFKSLEKLKAKHDSEIQEIRHYMQSQYPVIYTFSKELMDLRKQEKKYFTLKDYEKANQLKNQADRLE